MALIHKSFLLDTNGFIEKSLPIIEGLNSGSALLLYEETTQILQKMDPNRWILNTAGSTLLDIHKVNFVGLPYKEPVEPRINDISRIESCDLGYWFLIIFSTYLQKNNGIGINYSILKWCLKEFGWSLEDIELLMNGKPTSPLLKSDTEVQPQRLSYADPYWYWMRPSNSNRFGWLTRNQIDKLLNKLETTKHSMDNFNPERFGNHMGVMPITVPEGQIEYLHMAQKAFYSACVMLEKAISSNKELYMVIAYT